MGRAPCCEKVGLKRGPWTPEEDHKLVSYINENGHGSWRALPKKAGLLRCGKSCRLRWTNYLRPDIKRGEFSSSEEQTIIQLHALLGNRWSAIASHLPKRTDNEIKNYWNTHLKKKLLKMGLDPTTHKPKVDNTLMSSNVDSDMGADDNNGASFVINASNSSNGSSVTNHLAQWESARLEAEARLKQESQMRAKGLWRAGLGTPNPLNVAPLTTLSANGCAKPLNPFADDDTTICADALKALSAVELMNALHNWEKSLQGQAGMMWPDSWRSPAVHFPRGEVQAESSSCSSPCSDANTNIKTSPHSMDHSSPTSTLCSLDSHNIKQKGLHSPLVSCAHSSAHIRKLSWSDVLSPPLPKLEIPLPLLMSKGFRGFCMQGVSCKMEEDSSTFSNLMQDAVFGTDAMTSVYMSSVEEGGSASKNGLKGVMDEGACGKISALYQGVNGDIAGEGTYGEMCVTYGGVSNNVVDEGACGTPKETAQPVGSGTTDEGMGIVKDSDKAYCSEVVAGDVCAAKGDMDENVSSVLLGEMELNGDVKDSMMDHSDGDNNKSDDDDGKCMCVGGEIMSAEMFKDLPKLKSESSTPQLASYCGLLSEEIPDYWSSIMLKEPTLQQADMTF
eukprot:c19329_g1_i1 orf=561-2411(-)